MNGKKLELSKQGVSRYVITVSEGATEPERTAADELGRYLRLATGAAFPVVREEEAAADGLRIAVGHSGLYGRLFPEEALDALGSDAIVIRTAGEQLILAGGRPRGTLYAVYTFLEQYAGIRWWTPTDIDVPAAPDLAVELADTAYAPPFRIREVFSRAIRLTADELRELDGGDSRGIMPEEGRFAATGKLNGFFNVVPGRFGGHYDLLGEAHTFEKIIPPSAYFATHPEWFGEMAGRREVYQLCLTNEAMRRQFVANTLGWLGDHPGTICVSVSQNDYPEPCTCARCSAAIRELGSPTDLLLHFLNGVADAVERDYPGTVVETLAYQWTRKPPVTVRPRPNIMIRLCSIECSMNHPLDHEANRHFYDDLLGWAALTSNLYIWHYTLNAHNLAIPHPYAYGTAALLRQLSAFRVTGVFLQGDGFNLRGNFHELKAWVYAKLLWDPQQDEQALIDAFIDGYYGPAASAIRSLWQMLHERMRESGQYYGCFFRSLASYYDAYEKVLPQITTASWLDPADLNAAADWLDAAEAAAAGEPKYAARAADCRIAFDAVRLQDEAGLRLLARQSGLPFRGPAASEEGAVERYAARAAERFADYHVEGWRFGQGYTDYLQKRHIRLLDGADGAPAVEVSGSVFTQMTSARVHFRERNRATRTVDDPASARGTAAVLAPDEVADDRALAFVHNLACFYYYRAEGRWDIRLDIRCDTAAASGIVFRVQLVDILAGCIVAETPGLAEHLQAGVYRTYRLGAHRLRDGLFVRVAIADRASVAGVYLDRMLLTQGKEGERLEIGH